MFKSKISVFSVCSYCTTMVVRHDLNLEVLGKMAELPEDMSPLQLYAFGHYQNSAFEIVGRLRVGWSDGVWNEWYALFDDGRDGWLAEAQGFWMMSFESSDLVAPPLDSLSPGEPANIGARNEIKESPKFIVDDIKETTCIGSEGELPMQAPKGRKATAVDLSGPNDRFATLDYSEDGNKVFIGKYVDFENFRFSGLRQLDGW